MKTQDKLIIGERHGTLAIAQKESCLRNKRSNYGRIEMYKRHLIKLLGLTVLAAIGVMAVSASAAQAKWLLLLNGVSVLLMNLLLKKLAGYKKAENGLKIECKSGHGSAHLQLSADHKNLTASFSDFLQECVWVGSEKTCTINDGGKGLINGSATGQVVMSEEDVIIDLASSEISTIFTEGVFCTIPEEEVLSGKFHIRILGALVDSKVKFGHVLNLSGKLGNSPLTEMTGGVHISDLDSSNATIGFHLVGL